jgi:hypothetical protein
MSQRGEEPDTEYLEKLLEQYQTIMLGKSESKTDKIESKKESADANLLTDFKGFQENIKGKTFSFKKLKDTVGKKEFDSTDIRKLSEKYLGDK